MLTCATLHMNMSAPATNMCAGAHTVPFLSSSQCLSFFVFPRINGCREEGYARMEGVTAMTLEAEKLTADQDAEDEAFLRRVIFPEEDRHLFTTTPC
jgi:hypothetical protein